jgi:hypothetical protein
MKSKIFQEISGTVEIIWKGNETGIGYLRRD